MQYQEMNSIRANTHGFSHDRLGLKLWENIIFHHHYRFQFQRMDTFYAVETDQGDIVRKVYALWKTL